MYDKTSFDSILSYAKKLEGKTLKDFGLKSRFSGKGRFGQTIEENYFKYSPNSDSSPDFKEVGLELKCSPIYKLSNNTFRAKERVSLNIINFMKVYKETFEKSSFYTKNSHILFVFYVYELDKSILEYEIKLVGDWKLENNDLVVVKQDWIYINNKIISGKAHELSEGDTFYLGAATKGSGGDSSKREQPFSEIPARQRAYSFKQSYVNHILGNLSSDKKTKYGKILSDDINSEKTIEEVVQEKFEKFYGLKVESICEKVAKNLNKNAKGFYASLTKSILGINSDESIEEFSKANIIVKTVRLNEHYKPKEDLSFPVFNFSELSKTDWENSNFKSILERKFFFVFYKYEESELLLKRVLFWNMKFTDLLEAKRVYNQTKSIVNSGNIVKNIAPNGNRNTNFPGKKNSNVCHVRPHALNKNDTFPLPFADKLTKLETYTKHSFWLNADYIKNNIYFNESLS